MRNKIHAKKQLILWLLLATMIAQQITSTVTFYAFGQEIPSSPNKQISLEGITSLTSNANNSIVRLYGVSNKVYSVPILVTANCSLILDHINNQADITIIDGITVQIYVRGSNVLNNIVANGGSQTHVNIIGENTESRLTAKNIACPAGGSDQSGAEVTITDCNVHCDYLGCGSDGTDTSYWNGTAIIPRATPGSNASPLITIQSSEITVDGNMACGGNGIQSVGDYSICASHGGSSGEVFIDSSLVTVAGDISVGGEGGPGKVTDAQLNCVAGNTKGASPVTISNQSQVVVSGNVATQHDLCDESKEGSQSGLDGVTVEVNDSSLTAKDIASGGSGHHLVYYSAVSDSEYDFYGTAGGHGGTLIARNSQIICETAVCGGNAGEYTKKEDTASLYHPLDGNGGALQMDHSSLLVTNVAGEKGNRWNDTANPSEYSESTFLGGFVDGMVRGSTIKTDLTTVSGGGLTADKICNSENVTCAACVLQTSEALANETVQMTANDLSTTVALNEKGEIHTYLAVGNADISVSGSALYTGTFLIEDTAEKQVLQLSKSGPDYFTVMISFETPGVKKLTCNEQPLTVETDENGVASLLLAEGTYKLVIGDEALSFQADLNVLDSVQLNQTDMILYADISKGELLIGEDTVTLGEQSVQTNAKICIRQSDTTANAVYVQKKDADITLDGVTEDIQIYLPEDFCGQVHYTAERPDPNPDSDPENGSTTDTPTQPGTDTPTQPGTDTPTQPGTDTPTQPGTDTPTQPGTDTPTQPGTDTPTQPGTDTPTQPGTDTPTQPGTDTPTQPGTNTPTQPGTGTSTQPGQSGGTSSAGEQPDGTEENKKKDESSGSSILSASKIPSLASLINLKAASLKGINFLAETAKNTYEVYSKKRISIKIARAEDTDYYYKILRKGQNDTDGSWRILKTDRIIVPANTSSKGQRVFVKAVNEKGSIVKKTNGFVIDTQKPAVSGVKNARFYTKKRTIRVSDNCENCIVRLNGKQVDQTLTVKKKGIYMLSASDLAGNTRTVVFAII